MQHREKDQPTRPRRGGPVESMFFAIEVKSTLTAPELRGAIAKAKELRKLEMGSDTSADAGRIRDVAEVPP